VYVSWLIVRMELHMSRMMDGSGMMAGMGLFAILVLVLLVLAIAALWKYLKL
jgi:hypothetical protein